uniref:NADH-ubiquinone oxidoreductase chain 6 n=1 Tax=Chlorokybus atmophyticus TaxID=3144 RepID=A6YEA3_CHLAT|nr:NADH dehydrogenase subunit 6 [Chlorokybus atmophyticus]ABO15106.1 NADH dehydrogenase subunit 6 [Chlorokybus atmophyticus]
MTAEQTLFSIFSSVALISGIMVIRAKNPVHSVLFLILVFCSTSGLLLLLGLDFFAMVFLVVYVGAIAVLFLFVVMMLNIKMAEITENLLRYLPVGGLIGFIFVFEVLLVVDNDLIPLLSITKPRASLLTEYFQIYSTFFFQSFIALIRGKINLTEWNLDRHDLVNDLEQAITNLTTIFQGTIHHNEWVSKIHNVTNIEAIGQLVYTYYFYYFLMSSLILLVAMIGAILLTMHKGMKSVKRQEIFEQNARQFSKTIQKIR